MKRTPLRRNAKLHTRRPMRKRRTTPRRRGEYEDPGYADWQRYRPCSAPGVPHHMGGDPHHLRHDERGASLGAHVKDDRRVISLCRGHHRDIELGHGPWEGWTRAQIKAWENEQARLQREAYFLHLASDQVAKMRDPGQY